MGELARDIMNSDVVSLPGSMDVRDAAKLFLEKGITGAPVTDDQGDLVGVLSQTDLVYYNLTRDDELVMDSHFYQVTRMEGQHVPSGFQIEDCNTCTVNDVMTPVVHSVTEGATVDAVSRLMTRKHIHRVIVRRGRKVAGVISALDVLRVRNRQKTAAGRAKKNTGKSSKRPSAASSTL